jgi:predicted  nucleic acid-binding Zn-ribbon protein
MTPRLLKIIASVVLVLCLTSPAFAIVPLLLSAAEAAAPYVIMSGISMLLPTSATSNLPHTGTADSYGVKRNMLGRVGGLMAIAVAGTIAYDELRSLVGDPSTPSGKQYPSLSGALYNSLNSPPIDFTQKPYVDLTFIYTDNHKYKVVYVYTLNAGSSSHAISPYTSTGLQSDGYFVFCYHAPDYSQYSYEGYKVLVNDMGYVPPQYTPATDDVLPSHLNDPATGDISPQILPDLDKVISNNPDAVQLPPDTSKDISDAKKQVATDTVKTSDSKKVASLQSIRDAALANYNANPSAENKAALDKAEADLAEAESEQAQHDLQQQEDDDADSVDYTHPTIPALKKIDLSPLLQIGSVLNDKFPFSLLQTVSSMASSLIATPSAPQFTISFPAPFNYDWVVSLSAWDDWAYSLRFLIGAAFLVSVSMAILRRWV